MDTTPAIKNVCESIKMEYLNILPELSRYPHNRDERKKIFDAHLENGFSPEAKKHFIEQIREREKIHYDFMNHVFPLCYKDRFGKPLPEDFPPHDCTKDDYFAFILALWFEILKEPKTAFEEESKALVKPLEEHELHRHYLLEPHHPEHEEKNNFELHVIHIFEMAIDRLSRNVQFNHGEIDPAKMQKFLPKFPLGDKASIEMKNTLYWNAVLLYQDKVSQYSKELYYNKVQN